MENVKKISSILEIEYNKSEIENRTRKLVSVSLSIPRTLALVFAPLVYEVANFLMEVI